MSAFEEDAVALAWGAWVELGVSGWSRTHQDWAIDPEPLILLTAFLGDADGRLQDEAMDWCIRNWRSISKVRLRNFATRADPDIRASFGTWSATVNAHARSSWPLATESRQLQVTGRSSPPDLARPSTAWLRMRAVMGATASTEVVRYLLSHEPTQLSAARLAAGTGYAKRIVNEVCETLVEAAILSAHREGNRNEFELTRRAQVESLVGNVPPIRCDWPSVVSVATHLIRLGRATHASSPRAAEVEAHQALQALGSLKRLGLGSLLERPPAEPAVSAADRIGAASLSEWAAGRWSGPRFV